MGMKIKYMSDLHLEFGSLDVDPDNDGIDVLIIAGDINVKHRVDWINEMANIFEDVIYVPGNHEFYRGHIDNTLRHIKQDVYENVHVLQNEWRKIKGVTFHGSTMWTDYQSSGNQPLAMLDANERMSDHRYIRMGEDFRKFRAEDAAYEHMRAMAYLTSNVKEGDVVITHHAPHENSSLECFKGQLLNASYYSDRTAFMMTFKPSYWIHGHMHNTSDYVIDETRVLCNPRGYAPHDINPDFDINKCFIL
jgi:Icc-related predicted phosphoesterase